MFKPFVLFLSFTLIFQTLCATNLYVGYSSKSNNYATIQKAVDQAKSINPKILRLNRADATCEL